MKMSSMFLVLTFCLRFDLRLGKLDIPTAFLKGAPLPPERDLWIQTNKELREYLQVSNF